eukprot:1033129-Alexandrium_andersonii.AAC.1
MGVTMDADRTLRTAPFENLALTMATCMSVDEALDAPGERCVCAPANACISGVLCFGAPVFGQGTHVSPFHAPLVRLSYYVRPTTSRTLARVFSVRVRCRWATTGLPKARFFSFES